jgi:hypothetical protein
MYLIRAGNFIDCLQLFGCLLPYFALELLAVLSPFLFHKRLDYASFYLSLWGIIGKSAPDYPRI